VVAAAAIAVVGVSVPLGDLRDPWVDPLVILCVPVTVAVAVLRYRLWDLDRLVSRTVTYAVVTALLIVPYLVVVPATGLRLAGQPGQEPLGG
jgi:two-component system, NarL family, sensor kinase